MYLVPRQRHIDLEVVAYGLQHDLWGLSYDIAAEKVRETYPGLASLLEHAFAQWPAVEEDDE